MTQDLLYKVAYDEAVRALSEQRAEIDSFRARAGLLFSAAAITSSFLGALALRGGDSDLASWLALLANPREVIETYIESAEPAALGHLHRDLSIHMHGSWLENLDGLEQFASLFQIASGMLTLEVAFWVVAIAARS